MKNNISLFNVLIDLFKNSSYEILFTFNNLKMKYLFFKYNYSIVDFFIFNRSFFLTDLNESYIDEIKNALSFYLKSNNEVYNVLNYIKSKIISLNNRNFNYLEFKNCFNDFTSNQVKLLFDILIEKGWVLNKGIYFVLNNNFSIHFSENTSKAIHNFKDNNNYFEDYYSFLKNNERFENIIEFIDLKINNSIEKHLFLRILSDEKITMKDIKNEFDIDYYEYKKKIMFFLTKDKNIPENMFIDLFSKFHIEYDIFNYETSLPIESYNYLILYCKHVKKVNSYNKLKGSISVDLWHSKRKLLETKFNYKFENHASKLILEGARITIDDYIEKYLSKIVNQEKKIYFLKDYQIKH